MAKDTRQRLATSFKELLSKKSIEKITISDLTNSCGINRQTFYYYFTDIYDLMRWIYLTESEAAVSGKNTYTTWQEGLLRVFNYLSENKDFVMRTQSTGNQYILDDFLSIHVDSVVINVVREFSKAHTISTESVNYIIAFYRYAVSGMILGWVKSGMKETPETMVKIIGMLTKGNLVHAIERFDQYEHKSQS
ncbi:MAG: TetR/AcrR family transcriptional regulator C-terminal domain-containing protein [Solobacterium sp.]|nr:TetR/AcrR family transcriptional regulator C-terminal domain-containing protein [Solobacterium sp.]